MFTLKALCQLSEYAKSDPTLISNHILVGGIPQKITALIAELQFLLDANIKYSMGDTELEIKAHEDDIQKLNDALSVYEPGLVSEVQHG
jgi:hypothetical protein